MTVGVLLLAAGQSRRYGADKRLARLPTGETLLRASLALVLRTELPVTVCLRPDDVNLLAELQAQEQEQELSVVSCDRAALGMGATLAQGMAALPPWEAVIVMLADMPWIKSASLLALARIVTDQTIAVPVFRDQRGNPVAFGREYFDQLGDCQGDQGARSVVMSHASMVTEVAVEDEGILLDVDHPDDLSANR
ncbi:MAG: nucleotidyltransferase family protein [Halioglobus sp.]